MNYRPALLLVLLFLAGCATAPRVMMPSGPQETLQGFCRKYNIDCRWDGVSQAVNMVYSGKKISALVDSNIVIVDGKRLALSDALRRRHGAVVIPSDFERVVIGPAAKPQEDYLKGAATGRLKKVVVDAGHGGKDPGAIGHRGLKESFITLDIARRVAKNFEELGIRAVLTRDTDEFISLQRRTEIASQANADLFISIHANAHKNRRSHGVEVYYAAPLSLEDKLEAQRRVNEKKLFSAVNMQTTNPDVRGIVADMLYAYRLSLSPGLADSVARGMSSEISCEPRGSKPQRYYVLRNTLVPAVLIEVGFITNPTEAGLLQDKGYRQKIADAVTRNVLRCANDEGM